MKVTRGFAQKGVWKRFLGPLALFLTLTLLCYVTRTLDAAYAEVQADLPGLVNAGAAWADYDNDGDLDLILVGFENLVGDRSALWKNSAGSFQQATSGLPEHAYGWPAWSDYDHDGDLDLALVTAEAATGQYTTSLWKNSAGTFIRQQTLPIGKFGAELVWADYDSDGDFDLWVSGSERPVSQLHVLRNDAGTLTDLPQSLDADLFAVGDVDADGDADVITYAGAQLRLWLNESGTWVDTQTSFATVTVTAMAWADYDADGDLDLVLCGQTGAGAAAQNVAKLYRNDGARLTEASPALPPLASSSLAWGDYDNDGRLDLGGVTIQSTAANVYSGILRNTAGSLVDSGIQFPFSFTTAAAWGDYDNDGDLDLLLAGSDTKGQLTTRILQAAGGSPNTPPSAPSGPSASVMGPAVTLRWNPSADAQTATAALSYNLRMGRAPGGIDVVSPESDLVSGRRRLPQRGNVGAGTTARLILPAGTYYWSIQAVDTGYAAGPFSSEHIFTVASPEPAVATGRASGISATQATLRGEVDPRGAAASGGFEWGPTSAYGQMTPVEQMSGNGWRPVEQTVNGLAVGVEYHYRAVAQSGGITVFGSDHTFTTPRFMPEFVLSVGSIISAQAWGEYDRDGALEVMLGTYDPTSGQRSAQLWKYVNNGSFTKSAIDLPPLDGTVAWGDYNRDGDLDVVFSGWSELEQGARYVTQVWQNRNGTFNDILAGLPGGQGSTASWGDFDNDGDLDLLITGEGLAGQCVQVWRNDSGTFTQLAASFPFLSSPLAIASDFDGDGDLDLLITGANAAGPLTQIYRNIAGNFRESGQMLPGWQSGHAAAGDWDHDGDQDLVIGGLREKNGKLEAALEVWVNDHGQFSAAAELEPLVEPALAWGDFDNDGRLDLAAAGRSATGQDVVRLWRNANGALVLETELTGRGPVTWADYDRDSDLDLVVGGQTWRNETKTHNTPPSAPAGLSASVMQGQVALTWNAASDGQTPAAGLTYDLRVGTRPGGSDVVTSPADLATGTRRVAEFGAVRGTRMHLAAWLLPLGTYYWSVQAVDTALAGGPFAAETSFVLNEGAPWVDSGTALPSVNSAQITAFLHPRGLVTGVWLEWGSTSAYGESVRLPDQSGTTGRALTPTLTGLAVETLYHYRLVAVNSAGTTSGPDQTFTTQRFTPLHITPEDIQITAADWGDFDGDGDPDLVVCGTAGDQAVTQIWRNDRWVFRPAPIVLPGLRTGVVAWGDYDRDGDLDLLICGDYLTQVWRNNSGTLRQAASLTALVAGSAAWGDYDNDGDLDVILAGWDQTGDVIELWRFDGTAFVPSGITFSQLGWPHATWLDEDRDGDLDLVLVGTDLESTSPWLSSVVELWRNNGGQFTKSVLDAPAFGVDSVAWRDYDLDGDWDVALGFARTAAQVRRNQSGAFADSGLKLPAVAGASIAWADDDGDGDLDFAIAGQAPFRSVQQIWRNEQGRLVNTDLELSHGVHVAWADFDLDGDLDLLAGSQIWRNDSESSNLPPSRPQALDEQITGNQVSFRWSAAADDTTPPAGLSYDFRLESESTSLTGDLAPTTVQSRLIRIQTRAQNNSAFLDLPRGIYYWSVQALDASGLPGARSPERRLILSDDRDNDGLPDVWETTYGLDPNSGADATLDSDGDGFTNAQEFPAHTDPRDAQSVLAIVAVEPDGNDLLVSFTTGRAGQYRLERSLTSPQGPWSLVLENVPGDGQPARVRIPGETAELKMFYRVITQP